MPQCQASTLGPHASQGRCQRAVEEDGLCEVHNADATRLVDGYGRATAEAEALEILVSKMMHDMAVTECCDLEEIYTATAVVKAYAERLDRAIRAMEECRSRFPGDVRMSVSALGEKREAALAFLTKVEVRKEVLRQLEHERASQYTGRCRAFKESAGCGSRCLVPVIPGQPFCFSHQSQHQESLSEIARYRNLAREEFGNYACVSAKEDVLMFLRNQIYYLDKVIMEGEMHNRQFGCTENLADAREERARAERLVCSEELRPTLTSGLLRWLW
ncbi:hypothetical protein C8T65DRAFT_64218 [Cerioporus squamosus]|nr:hypothetical protein C8T65DRAFT_64218 [Cerioporus squamosus]